MTWRRSLWTDEKDVNVRATEMWIQVPPKCLPPYLKYPPTLWQLGWLS